MRHLYISDLIEKRNLLQTNKRKPKKITHEIQLPISKTVFKQWREHLIFDENDCYSMMLTAYGISDNIFKSILNHYFNNRFGSASAKISGGRIQNGKTLFTNRYSNVSAQLNIFSKILIDFDNEFNSFQNNCEYSNLNISNLKILQKDLYKYLFMRILTISEETLRLEFKVLEEKEKLGVINQEKRKLYETKYLTNKDFQSYLISEYPVLFRLVKDEIVRHLANSKEFLTRLDKDLDSILQINGYTDNEIVGLKSNLSYPRNQGKTAYIIKFKRGKNVVYKPWCIKMQAGFGDFINGISRNFKHPLYTPLIEARNDYGWMEFINLVSKPVISQLKQYNHQTGNLLAILYLLDATDFHFGNIIYSKHGPVVIDCETLFHPEKFALDNSREKPALTENDVLKVGLLNSITESYFYELNNCSTKSKNNLIEVSNKIMDGFEEAYLYFCKNKYPLFEQIVKYFENCTIRVILRDNRVYDHLRAQRLKPEKLTDGYKSDIHFDWLWGHVPLLPYLKHTVIYEKMCLLKEEIPVFNTYFSCLDLFHKNNLIQKNQFYYTAQERLNLKFKALGIKDLESQKAIIGEIILESKKIN